MKISVVQLELKKIHDIEIDLPYDEIHTASYAAPLFCQKIGSLNIEHTAMVSLDNADRIINFFIVSMGAINYVKVSLAQMFRAALLSNASKIIVAHNHPSGVLEITSKDIEMTRKIAFFARSFDIELIDSLVVTRTDYISIRSHCREFLNEQKTVVKIKDSVDIFLSNEHYLMVYYMNSRQRKSFRANEEMVHLLETIDGEKTVEEIVSIMTEKWSVDSECTNQIMDKLQENRIITEVVSQQNILSEKLIKRYTRQINYFSEFLGSELEGIAAQRKLMDSNIIIFGCGAVGGNIAMQLVMAGVGHIILFDYDRNEPSDVSRHMYFRKQYIEMNKVDSLKAELMQINSATNVRCIVECMKPETDVVELIKSADFVVNTLDEPYIGYTASKISRICVKYKIPHYIAGGFDAHLASTGELIIPYVTPCVECYTTHFREVLKGWKPKKHPVERRYTEIGGLASMSLFSSSYACIEIIKCIAGLVQMEDSYKIRGEFLFHDMSLTYLNVKKNPECPICGRGEKDES